MARRYKPGVRRTPRIQAAARRNAGKAHALRVGLRGGHNRSKRRP